ncbi:hypothetical protein C8F01DRAFT_1085245 [Mycena amicta]|nr:hypothetical protein C8F01DRAFT_1085245 [Mycena amicta]
MTQMEAKRQRAASTSVILSELGEIFPRWRLYSLRLAALGMNLLRSPPMVKLYPCTCKRYGCNRGSITVAGTVQPGKWVTSAVRKVHQNGAGPTRKNRRRNWSLSSRPNREDSASASGTDLQDSEEEDNSGGL